ncbi:hypothetical protein EPIR_3207 [Erwinia piriflorinigrans CFBP 5888]|uniref:Uncharacterized protein n=1 Tax=Erwinia piriflorinigrans CFBP 5888 TaxID=1161919 RepID=V5ZBE4_9GAMM|nr:hypothetical protein EPIR_3207 [Erwinia piriflorinigrans CFBP 5888]
MITPKVKAMSEIPATPFVVLGLFSVDATALFHYPCWLRKNSGFFCSLKRKVTHIQLAKGEVSSCC